MQANQIDYTAPHRYDGYCSGVSLTALSLLFACLSSRKHRGKTLFKKQA